MHSWKIIHPNCVRFEESTNMWSLGFRGLPLLDVKCSNTDNSNTPPFKALLVLLMACCKVKFEWVTGYWMGLDPTWGKWLQINTLGLSPWFLMFLQRVVSEFLIGGTSIQLLVASKYKITVWHSIFMVPSFIAWFHLLRGHFPWYITVQTLSLSGQNFSWESASTRREGLRTR